MDVHDFVLVSDEETARRKMEETECEAWRVYERDAIMIVK